VQTFTGNKTLALADINTYNVSQDGTAQEVTVPAQATVTWTADAEIHIEQGGAGVVTVTGATGVTINGVSAGSFDLAGQFSAATLKRVGSDAWTLIFGAFAYNRENILGTVSQTAGVPTGALIESGSNANGLYERYASGLQICWNAAKSHALACNITAGNIFRSDTTTWTYPATFSSIPSISGDMDQTTIWITSGSASTTTTTFRSLSYSTNSSTTLTAHLLAVGRWF
jgi:hypothetical protein